MGKSDVVDGWREHRAGGGIVMDVLSNTIVAGGLSMPHSPRWHQGKLWLLSSGTGDAVHWLRIEGIVDELYDVITLPGVQRPMALGFKTDEINRVISVEV